MGDREEEPTTSAETEAAAPVEIPPKEEASPSKTSEEPQQEEKVADVKSDIDTDKEDTKTDDTTTDDEKDLPKSNTVQKIEVEPEITEEPEIEAAPLEEGAEKEEEKKDSEQEAAEPSQEVAEKQPLTEKTPENGDVENGQTEEEAEDSKKSAFGVQEIVSFFKRKENIIFFIGGITFLIGLIMIVIGLMVMQGKCDKQQYWKEDTSNTGPIMANGDHLHDHGVYTIDGNNTEESMINLAVGKNAYMSSTWGMSSSSLYNASLATDGNLNNRFNKGSCAQTDLQTHPYWYTDLEVDHTVSRVKVVLPGDCCSGELHDFEIRVGSEVDLQLNQLCKHFMGTALKPSYDIKCDRPVTGQFVSVQMLGDDARPKDRLTLCEVMVFG